MISSDECCGDCECRTEVIKVESCVVSVCVGTYVEASGWFKYTPSTRKKT